MKTTTLTLLLTLLLCQLQAQLQGEFYFDIIENQQKDFTYSMREIGSRMMEVRCYDKDGNLLGKDISRLGGQFQTDGSFRIEQVHRIVLEYNPTNASLIPSIDSRGGMSICYMDTYAHEKPLESGASVSLVIEAHDLYFTKCKFKSTSQHDYILRNAPVELIKM